MSSFNSTSRHSPSSPSSSRHIPSSSLPSRFSLDSHFSSRQTPTPTLPASSSASTLAAPSTPRKSARAHLRSSIMEPYALIGYDAYGEKYYDDTTGNYDKVNRRQVQTDIDYTVTSLSWLRESLHLVCQPDGGDRYRNEEEVVIPRIIVPGLGLADNMYKVEIGRLALPVPEDAYIDPNEARPEDQPVVLYITSHAFEFGLAKAPFGVKVFVGISAKEMNVGWELGPPAWLWSHSADVEFTKDVDWVEVMVPLFDIMDRPEAISADGLSFSVLICSKCPHRARKHPTHPPEYPSDIQNGFANLVDDHTGDVVFVVLEHGAVEDGGVGPDHGNATRLSRKRVLKAHSSILKSRSEYFKALLAGGFAESEGESKTVTIVVDDVPYDTMYWLLKFIYANVLSFRHDDDVRMVMDREQLHKGTARRILNHAGPGAWEYRQIPPDADVADDLSEMDLRDDATVKSVSSAGTSVSQRVVPSPSSAKRDRALSSASSISKASTKSKVSTSTTTSATPRAPPSRPAASSKTSPVKMPMRNFPLRNLPEPDPHPHPSPAPGPASALSVYMAAHRYQLSTLEELAKDQMLYRLTIENCVPTLLSTYPYKELHGDILNWIMDRFGLVKASPEFAQCIKEVSQGVWGETGGQVLLGLFARF